MANALNIGMATLAPSDCHIALKEWAVTVHALDSGHQVLLLRKGGIRDERQGFRVLYPEFLLYPTFEHQSEDLLKEEYQRDLREVASQVLDPETVTFTHWAHVEEVIEVADQEKVDALSPNYIWTEEYAQKRLHWKPRHPLSIMLLRLYRTEKATTVPYLPHYSGCKSWVELDQGVPLGRLTPVITDEAFNNKVREIKAALGLE